MGKQKIVVRVSMEDTKKQAKALRTAAGLPGVVSAAREGDQIVVVGDGIDASSLTQKLRMEMGFAELVSVAPVGEKEEVDEEGSMFTNLLHLAVRYIESYRERVHNN